MALAQAVTAAIGIGCRRGVAAEAIVALVRETLAAHEVADMPPLFSIETKADEAGLIRAARLLTAPVLFLSRESLAEVAGRAITHSPRVTDLFGLPSVAETAALAGAGPGGTLAGPRLARDGVTCALAWARI